MGSAVHSGLLLAKGLMAKLASKETKILRPDKKKYSSEGDTATNCTCGGNGLSYVKGVLLSKVRDKYNCQEVDQPDLCIILVSKPYKSGSPYLKVDCSGEYKVVWQM